MSSDSNQVKGTVEWELVGPDGKVKSKGTAFNQITNVGDQRLAEAGVPPAAGATAVAAPTGMRLGTGATTAGNAPAKSGTGAALATKLTDGNQAFDAGFPTSALVTGTPDKRRITFKVTYAAGKATSAGAAITEAVIVNDTITSDVATAAASTLARVALAGIASKQAADTLTVTWTWDIGS